MGFSRINVFALLRDHYRYLVHVATQRPVRAIRALIWATAPVLGFVSYLLGWRMNSIGVLAGALGLLAGVFVSAFAIAFSLRLQFEERLRSVTGRRTAELIDEAALTLLAVGLLSGLDTIWLSVLAAITPVTQAQFGHLETAITVALTGLVTLYFLMGIRRLHVLYTDTFPPPWKRKS